MQINAEYVPVFLQKKIILSILQISPYTKFYVLKMHSLNSNYIMIS